MHGLGFDYRASLSWSCTMIVLFTVHDFFVYHTLRNILIKIYPVVLTITTFAATMEKI